jgi:hypothetical protein
MDRHARQVRLAGVGAEGQARIARAVIDIPVSGLAAEVAARYLAGAGVAGLRVGDPVARDAARAVDSRVNVDLTPRLASEPFPPPLEIRDPVARSVAVGALVALRALNAALGDTS